MLKIVIADDHSILRAGIKKILEKEVDLQVVGEAGNYHEVLELVNKVEFDLLVLDINMPGASGLGILKEIKKIKPQIKILILTIYPEESFAVRAFELGAAGYLTKESTPELLVKAIQKIKDGGKYLSEKLGEKLASRIDVKYSKSFHERLSTRETEVLLLIGEGKTTSEIAQKLSLSINTVATYRARILEKMNLSSNVALIHYVIKNGLLK
jgi:two-component system, NarL family, invasion response regulator UvrY